tara:strand:+ start:546 stop:1235 length:690 start_codon:yes stop_codon:yes gene_type:complete
LTDYQICEIDIEKSTTAKELEKIYSCEWGFNQNSTIDPFYILRACITKSVTFPVGKMIPIPTGIYPQIKNPNFSIEITSFSDLVYEQGITLADGISTCEYTFRNEIWLLLQNNSEQVQTLQPTQKVATFSVNYRPRMVINYVEQIEDIAWKNSSAKNYIQKIKKKISPEIYDLTRNKPPLEDMNYSRETVELYKNGGIGTVGLDKNVTMIDLIQEDEIKEPTGVKPSES